MDYKEKYEMALEGVREILGSGEDSIKMSRLQLRLQGIFPELKESENERIVKCLLNYFHHIRYNGIDLKGVEVDDVIAWLEKQGEQKPQSKTALDAINEENVDNANNVEPKDYNSIDPNFMKPVDKVEPKFHKGDWVVNKLGDSWHIDSFDKKNYQVSDGNGNYNYFPISKQDEMHLYTIKDAKAGDILVYKGNVKNSNGIKYERICLFNNLNSALFTLTKTSNYVEEYDINVNIDYPDDTIPANKEQRDTLVARMIKEGVGFGFENKVIGCLDFEVVEEDDTWDPRM